MEVSINNPAGWSEYENQSLDELEQNGFDGAILPDNKGFDGFVFNPKQIKMIKWIDNN